MLRPRLLSNSLLTIALLSTGRAVAAPTVWAIDDGEKIKQDALTLPFKAGTDNPVWSPSQPIKLFALRGETVAFQVIVQADATTALDLVTVDLDGLTGPGGATIKNTTGATDPTRFVGRPIERFVEHYFNITRVSGGSFAGDSLGWSAGSGPPVGKWTGLMPDALIPVEVAPGWSPYPMHINADRNGAVWIDVTVADAQPAGLYTGSVVVQAGTVALATLPVELEVIGVSLPDRPVKTMLFYDTFELRQRIGTGAAPEEHLWKLLRRHHLTAMHSADSLSSLTSQLKALDGSLYTAANGYEGPGEGQGDGILSIGSYGGLSPPDGSSLPVVAAIADQLAQSGLLGNGTTDAFIYATDEDCSSSLGQDWKNALAQSSNANVKKLKVGWTCSTNPANQPVDIPMVFASQFNRGTAATARAAGKQVWIYNGSRPQSGTFLTDSEAVSLRVNGWIGATTDIGRWFYWETTFWYDGNNGGHGPYDPFVTAETFHNNDGDYCQGDGVLLYPGKQIDQFTTHSVGMTGVIASIRLKNFRRGIEDAGYFQLAHAANPAAADAIAAALLPGTLNAATSGTPVSWTDKGQPWFDARKALLALIPQGSMPPSDGGSTSSDGGSSSSDGGGPGTTARGCACHVGGHAPLPVGWALLLLGIVVVARRSRGR